MALIVLFLRSSPRGYNVILITIDTLRADHLSCYNPQAGPTPNLDALARRAVVFKNAYTLIPITLPSHLSILASRQPHLLHVFNNGETYDHSAPLISETFASAGYKTAAFVSLGVLRRNHGTAYGFQTFEDNFGQGTSSRRYKLANEINNLVIPWLEQTGSRRFFAWIHYSDPHEPYVTADAPPDTRVLVDGRVYREFCLARRYKETLSLELKPGQTKVEFQVIANTTQGDSEERVIDVEIPRNPRARVPLSFGPEWYSVSLPMATNLRAFNRTGEITIDNMQPHPRKVTLRFWGGIWNQPIEQVRGIYTREVQYVDRYFGQFWDRLSQLGLTKNTIVVVTADHGEGLGSHGTLGHTSHLWDEIIRVPLIVYYPGEGRRGVFVDSLVNLLDVAPTILDLARVSPTQPMEGRSLKNFVTTPSASAASPPFLQKENTIAATYAPEAHFTTYAATDGKVKVICLPTRSTLRWEIYDLIHDPDEQRGLSAQEYESIQSVRPLQDLLQTHMKSAQQSYARRKAPNLSEEEKETLRSLGYVNNPQ